jgi:hypothetical protein
LELIFTLLQKDLYYLDRLKVQAILWTEKTEELNFSFFENYLNALTAYLNTNLIKVNSIEQLSSIKILFVIDEHFRSHKEFLTSLETIKILNNNKTKVVIFNTEKIFNSHWKHNIDIYQSVLKINNLVYLLSDALDIKKIGTPMVNKQYLSKSTSIKNHISLNQKKNAILFFGQLDGSAYNNRRQILNKFLKLSPIPIEIKKSERLLDYSEYLNLISSYKYILNPLGAGEFLNLRFFETLEVNSIPVQEYSKNMLEFNQELSRNVSINFQSLRNINLNKFEEVKSNSFRYYLEDYFYDNNFYDLINK